MPKPAEYSFLRYLAAKKSVDDRALNRQVWESFRRALTGAAKDGPLRMLEVGCGSGAMAERLLDWGFLKEAVYLGIDLIPECLTEARRRVKQFARQKGLDFQEDGSKVRLCGRGLDFTLGFEAADIFDFAARTEEHGRWEALLAHAFLDLVDLNFALPRLFSLLRPGGWFYFTLNYDGSTVLLPQLDPELDRRIEDLYHQTMVRHSPSGKISPGSLTGRRLFEALGNVGAEILAAGGSDWVVFPQGRSYPQDEAYFLHFLIHTVFRALAGHPALNEQTLSEWVRQRQAQIEAGRLILIARNLDFFGRLP